MPLLPVKNFGYSSGVFKGKLSFSGLKTCKISHLGTIEQLSSHCLDGIYESLKDKVAPDFIQTLGGDNLYKRANSLSDALKYPFTKLPLELLNAFANKFHIEKLQNSKTLTEFRKAGENEKCERALRGLLQNGDNFLNGAAREKGISPCDIDRYLHEKGAFCGENPEGVCNGVVDRFYKLFDDNLAPGRAKYNTTGERTIVRAVSGFSAACMLGNDFYNKSIQNGKNEAEAKKEAKTKKKQEIIATFEEAISQYFMLSACSGFVNNSKFGAPVVNTLLGLLFHVTSRLSTGMPLRRIKPENLASKENDVQKENLQSDKTNKTHVLCGKNIILACLLSIGAGFALKGIKNAPAFKNIKALIMDFGPVKSIAEKFKSETVGELWASKQELTEFSDTLCDLGYKNMEQYYSDKIKEAAKKQALKRDDKIFIGKYEKFVKVPFINVEVSKKELLSIPFAPFKIIKEIASYPYKLVRTALEGLNIVQKQQNGLKNELNLVNTFMDFQKQAQKFGGDIESEEFITHYAKHIEENRLSVLNMETKSNINNYGIGKLSAILGIFGSIYFASTDDYNSTLMQTGDVEKANKDARLRGVNKVIRTSVQCVFLGLNNLFKIPYSQSLVGAGIITAACTVLTDGVSRILSGMPFKRMSKEELEQYNNNKKEGILKGYFEFLDKLTQ